MKDVEKVIKATELLLKKYNGRKGPVIAQLQAIILTAMKEEATLDELLDHVIRWNGGSNENPL